jgi:hypothetical protein
MVHILGSFAPDEYAADAIPPEVLRMLKEEAAVGAVGGVPLLGGRPPLADLSMPYRPPSEEVLYAKVCGGMCAHSWRYLCTSKRRKQWQWDCMMDKYSTTQHSVQSSIGQVQCSPPLHHAPYSTCPALSFALPPCRCRRVLSRGLSMTLTARTSWRPCPPRRHCQGLRGGSSCCTTCGSTG